MRFFAKTFSRPSLPPPVAQLTREIYLELAALLRAATSLVRAPRPPLNFELEAGGVRAHLRAPLADHAVCLSLRDGERAYDVNIPSGLRDGTVPHIEVTWTSPGAAPCTQQLAPSEFRSMQVPQEFQELHAHLAAHLRLVLPASLRAKLGLAEKAGGAKAAAGADASATSSGPTRAAKPAEVDAPFQLLRLQLAGLCTLEFEGRLLAQVAIPFPPVRQYVMRVFEARDGRFIVARSSLSLCSGKHEKTEARAFDTLAGITTQVGYSGAAPYLYAALRLTTAHHIP